MPLVDVTYDRTLDEEVLRRLTELLPDVVAEAVDCQRSRGSDLRDRVTSRSASTRSRGTTSANSTL
jgi:hypothetical protein